MRSAAETDVRVEGIARTLSDDRLQVPRYQRAYAWRREHVQELFDDLSRAIEGSVPDYFLGSIVIAEDTYVVDGQQRLATVSILIAAIRDYFRKIREEWRAEEVQGKYLFHRDLKDGQVRPRLSLNSADHEFFLNAILEPGSVPSTEGPMKPSHANLRTAADVAAEQVASLVNDNDQAVDTLVNWLDYLEDHARVIVFRVRDDSNAFIIFETLNDRGLELATSDLLKNFLFKLAKDRIDEVEARWMEMVGALEATEIEDLSVTYIRHLWSSRHGSTRERELYKRIKEKVRTQADAIAFASELQSAAQVYTAILSPQKDAWRRMGGDAARRDMETLNKLGMKQLRPLLLAILRSFPAREVAAALNLLVSVSVRLLIVGSLGGGTQEEHYCSAAKEITEGSITNTRELARGLNGIVPNDIRFRDAFQATTVSKAVLARYYLGVLEQVATGDGEPALVPNPDAAKVNLEHVLPEKPLANWPQFTDEEASGVCNRLGNLALLKGSVNSKLRSAPFEQKKAMYERAPFELTKQIAEYAEWTSSSIDGRQRRLAELAVKAWPFRA